MWEPALSTGICHQLSHRCDPRLSQCGGQGERTALNHPTAAAENRHSNTLSPTRRKIRNSFWGRKQGTVFVGFYSIQENKAQGKKGLFCYWNFFTFYSPLQNKAHRTSSIARPLWSRGSGTTWFTHQYLCSQGASLIINWIPTMQLIRKGIRQGAITFT